MEIGDFYLSLRIINGCGVLRRTAVRGPHPAKNNFDWLHRPPVHESIPHTPVIRVDESCNDAG